jgi:putative transcriptional regulator
MNNSNSIFEIKDYGKVHFHVKEIMDRKNMTRSKLAKLANIRFEVADKWCSGEIERMDIDVLTRICYVLDCKISDLMTYHK